MNAVPSVTFRHRIGDEEPSDGGCPIGGEWVDLTSEEIFKDKRVIVFALPGAFTPTCSSQQLPGYEKNYYEFKRLGIDEIYCLSVNDSFVMNAWFEKLGVKCVKPLADGNGKFSAGMDMLVDKSDLNFGFRSWRYAMIVNNGSVEKMFEEPCEDGDPYGVSSPESVMEFLKNNP